MLRLLFFLALFISGQLFGQTSLSGIVNTYAKVTAIDYCESKLIIDNTGGFSAEGLVILIQMKGATIQEGDNSNFGDLQDIGSAGLYEKAAIVNIIANEIQLEKKIGQYL